jgi:Holliday junction resolvase RusA-like endonuclease
MWPTEPTPDLHFRVSGNPTSQGSKRGFVNPKTKRVVVVEQMGAELKTWRQDVIAAARAIRTAAEPLDVALSLKVVFYLKRPQAHYGAHGVKPNAPRFSKSAPDLDKLLRALLDAITISGLWQDDGRVAKIAAAKAYSDEPGAEVWIAPIPGVD